MGVTNFDNLPQNQVQTKIIQARQVMRERKAAQRVAGANLRYYTSESDSQFDWLGQLTSGTPQDPTMGDATFDVVLTATTAKVPLVDLAVAMYVSSDGTNWTFYSDRQSQIDAWALNWPQLTMGLREYPGALNSDYESRWFIGLLGKASTHVGLKLQATGMDQVSISITRTA